MKFYHFLHWRVARLIGRVLAWAFVRKNPNNAPSIFPARALMDVNNQVAPEVAQAMIDRAAEAKPDGLIDLRDQLQQARADQSEQEVVCWEKALRSARRRSLPKTSGGVMAGIINSDID